MTNPASDVPPPAPGRAENPLADTVVLDAPPTAAAPSYGAAANGGAPSAPRRAWWPLAFGAAVVLAAVGVVLALTVFAGGDDDAAAAYRDKVTAVLRPVISANRDLSSSLEALQGTRPALAQRRVKAAQAVTLKARGGLDALTVPRGTDQAARNARGTLTRESAYLAAVSAVLANPANDSASQTQTLAANLTGALDVVSPADDDWSQSVTGADVLTAWAPKAARTIRRRKATARRNAGESTASGAAVPAAGSATAGGGGTDCGNGLHAGPNTSCPFAQNVRDAYNEAPGSRASVRVYSPVTGTTYTMSCAPAGDGVTCSGGNNASVTWSY